MDKQMTISAFSDERICAVSSASCTLFKSLIE